MDKTVTLTDAEWQQLASIFAQATGYVVFNKLVSQLQAQDVPRPVNRMPEDGERETADTFFRARP